MTSAIDSNIQSVKRFMLVSTDVNIEVNISIYTNLDFLKTTINRHLFMRTFCFEDLLEVREVLIIQPAFLQFPALQQHSS